MSTASRVVSSFNPTKTYYIPTHGGVILSSSPLYIYDLTPKLKHRVPAEDAYSDRKAFKRDVREVLKAWKEQEKDGKGKGADAMGMLEPAAVVKRGRKGGKVLEDVDSRGMASWNVPWALWKEIVVDVQYPDRDEWDVVVCTDSYDPRSQFFDLREARLAISTRKSPDAHQLTNRGKKKVQMEIRDAARIGARKELAGRGTVRRRRVLPNNKQCLFPDGSAGVG